MRNMSFMLTTPQILNRTKTVTRRNGWRFLRPDDLVQGVNKSQGLKKGEHPVKLEVLRVLTTVFEPLCYIRNRPDDCVLEGFPEMTPDEFIRFYCKHNKVNEWREVNRIHFAYVD